MDGLFTENGLNKILFTEYDADITGASQRDPLGLQPIWSYYGRRIVKHLTTISTDIHGFREVALCLAVCNDIRAESGVNDISEPILIFEQIFMYSAIAAGKTDGILGADNGRSKYNKANRDPVISVENTILASQLSLGYYGRYKTPLSDMGITEADNKIKELDHRVLYGAYYEPIRDAFKGFLELSPAERRLSRFDAADELMAAVFGRFRPGEKEFWLERLQIDGAGVFPLMRACYDNIDESREYVDTEAVLRAVYEHADETDKRALDDVLRLEPFLRCVEEAFYKMLNVTSTDGVVYGADTHKARYAMFLSVKEPTDAVVATRYKKLIKCDPSGDYLKSIYDYHSLVCEQKHRAPWLELKNGSIQMFTSSSDNVDINSWGRNYYLGALFGIKKGITAIENGR